MFLRWLAALTAHRFHQLWYAPVLALAMGLMLLRMMLLARLLDVEGFGEFSAGMLVSGTFCMLGCLGLQSMLQREWPVKIFRGLERHALIRASQCNLIAVVCCIAGLIAAGFADILGLMPKGMTLPILVVGILHGYSQQLFLVATIESRSRGDSLRFARQNLLRAIVVISVGAAAAFITESAIICLLTDAIATFVFSIIYLQKAFINARNRLPKAILTLLALRQLQRTSWTAALTLTLVTAASFGLINADRWVAATILNVEGFAHYAFAWILLSFAQSVQLMINTSIYPLLARRYAEYGQIGAYRVCILATAGALTLSAIFYFPIEILLNYLINFWYPQYSDALVLLPLFLVVALFRVSDFWTSFLLICRHEARLLKVNIIVASLGGCVWLIIVQPWSADPLTLIDVGLLPALLATVGFVAVASTAWKVRKCATV